MIHVEIYKITTKTVHRKKSFQKSKEEIKSWNRNILNLKVGSRVRIYDQKL